MLVAKYVIWYMIWLVSTGRVKRIELKFMIKGHTHFIVDSGIGHTKRELRVSGGAKMYQIGRVENVRQKLE